MIDVLAVDVVAWGFGWRVVAALDGAAWVAVVAGEPICLAIEVEDLATRGVAAALDGAVAPRLDDSSSSADADAAPSGGTSRVETEAALVAVVGDCLNKPGTAIESTSARPPTINAPSARTRLGNRHRFMGADARQPEIALASKHC
ncbi:MAG: hypothetical protein U0Q19_21075 [Kineosporiaceae bacterium]